MSKRKKRKGGREENKTTWQIIKDLFLNPFEYRRSNKNLGKILGGICLFLAICLLFYMTGNNFYPNHGRAQPQLSSNTPV